MKATIIICVLFILGMIISTQVTAQSKTSITSDNTMGARDISNNLIISAEL